MATKVFKVYGEEGHRQRESFAPSYEVDDSTSDNLRVIEVWNSDKTGTHDYSIVVIARNSAEECYSELEAQLNDGIFENSRVGKVEEIQ